MHSVSVRLFVGILLGITVGAWLANQLPFILWWLGIPMGSIVGGLVFAHREIIHSIPLAAQRARASLELFSRNWADPLRRWKYIYGPIVLITVFLTFPSVFLISLWVWNTKSPDNFHENISLLILGYWFLQALVSMGAWLIGTTTTEVSSVKRHTFIASPFGLPSLIGMNALAIIAMSFLKLKKAWEEIRSSNFAFEQLIKETSLFVWRFSRELFLLVHSKALTIAVLFSAFGVAIVVPLSGFTFGITTLAGALLGAFAGVVYYEVISKRVLHVNL